MGLRLTLRNRALFTLCSGSLGRSDPTKRETQISKVLPGTRAFLLPVVPREQPSGISLRIEQSRFHFTFAKLKLVFINKYLYLFAHA